MLGCLKRVARLFSPVSKRTVVLPLDQGVHEGAMPGFGHPRQALEAINDVFPQAVLLSKGAARSSLDAVPVAASVIVQLSGSTKHGQPAYARTLVCSLPEALRLGADLVSIQVNIGNDFEDRMLADLGAVCDEAHNLGLPVLALIQPAGGHIVNGMDQYLIAHCVRLGCELGADLTGVPYPGKREVFEAAVGASSVPVLVTGGLNQPTYEGFLKMIGEALDAGAAGTCLAKPVLSQPDPAKALRQLLDVVHDLPEEEEAEPGAQSEAEAAKETPKA